MCIKNGLQFTDIVKEYYFCHFLSLYLALKKSAAWTVSS